MIHSFERAEQVDRAALPRLFSSISRFLSREEAVAPATGMDVEVVDSRRLGGTWTLDRVWERLGIGAAIRRPQREAGSMAWRSNAWCSHWSRNARSSEAGSSLRRSGLLSASSSTA